MFRILFALCALLTYASAQLTPKTDHHQHIFSPDVAKLIKVESLAAKDIIALLDEAGIEKAAILSMGYTWGKPGRNVENEYDHVKAENDYTSSEVAKYPKRLVGFCGVNPLRDYAMEEIARCAKDPNLRRGLKLHIGNSAVDYHKPEHIKRLKEILAAANKNKMAILVHMRSNFSLKLAYGADEARIFLEQVIPSAPDVPIQIAHLAGSGPGYSDSDPDIDAALSVFAEAIEKKDPRTKNLYFDVASNVTKETDSKTAALVVKRLRQIGMKRILFGSDAHVGDNMSPKEAWAAFRKLPLTEKEFRLIAGNTAPCLN